MKQISVFAWRVTWRFFFACLGLLTPTHAQVNSGSNGSDGVFNPTTNVVINMADHGDGIYHYRSVQIPSAVTVSFLPNSSNTPVVWLVQGDCEVQGTILLNGQSQTNGLGGSGGPGGFSGGTPSLPGLLPGAGFGPGGGTVGTNGSPGNASFGSRGQQGCCGQNAPGETYGNSFLLPLVGGSGGGGPGGGGGGAILIAASGEIRISGAIRSDGGNGAVVTYGNPCPWYGCLDGSGGGGSGGAIRLVATTVSGTGQLSTSGGSGLAGANDGYRTSYAGTGRIRIDALSDTFSGSIGTPFSRGFQPIIILPQNESPGLAIQSIAGLPVPSPPQASQTTPDVIVPGQQTNPITIQVHCENIPLGSDIIVEVKPAHGANVMAIGKNNAGSVGSSTAFVSVNIPRGGGTIQAKTVSDIVTDQAAGGSANFKNLAFQKTGVTTDGERFKTMEVTAGLDGKQQLVYITESGKRFPVGKL